MPNRNYVQRLFSYLSSYPSDYLIIGGTAAELVLSQRSVPFRETKDFDIVICWDGKGELFPKVLVALLRDGGYRSRLRNSKKTAYRFEDPLKSGYPSIIELFCKRGTGIASLDGHLAKTEIPIDDDRLSAIVLDERLYEFAQAHRTSIDGLSVLDIHGLVFLKCIAYFENHDLFLRGKADRHDYLKHRRDIIVLLGAMRPDEIRRIDHPSDFDECLLGFLDVLKEEESIQSAAALGYRGAAYEEIQRRFAVIFVH